MHDESSGKGQLITGLKLNSSYWQMECTPKMHSVTLDHYITLDRSTDSHHHDGPKFIKGNRID